MESRGKDKFAEVREGLYGLLTSIDRIEETTGINLAELQLDIETLIGRIERALRAGPEDVSAVITFDQLLRLDSGFTAIASKWTNVRRSAGVAAAQEIVNKVDLHAGWRERWRDSFEYAWKYRAILEERAARTEAQARQRQGAEPLPQVLALDLRYATELPLAHIAEFFHLSASAVQARVANFEGRVAEEIVSAVIRQQLPSSWRIISRNDASDFELCLEGVDDRRLVINIPVVPAWPDRESSVGRPREFSSQTMLRNSSQERERIWAVIFFEGLRVYFIPDDAARGYSRETRIPYARLETVIQLASSVGFERLGDAIDSILASLPARRI